MSELFHDSKSPRVDDVIEVTMKRFPGVSASAQARYYEAVHQELTPLARELEQENAALRGQVLDLQERLRKSWRDAVVANKEGA